MTPTREAVTWGSPLYTFRWLLDRGSCEGRGGGLGESSPGPMVPAAAALSDAKITPSPFSRRQWRGLAEVRLLTALPSVAPGQGEDEPRQGRD